MQKRRVCDQAFTDIPSYTEVRAMDEVKAAAPGSLPHLMKFESKFAILDKANGNRRVYPKALYDKYFKTDEYTFRLKEGLINGQIKHPKGDPDPTLISHIFDKFYTKIVDDNIYLMCSGRIVDTLMGRVLYGLKQSGVNLGISQRSLCDSEINEAGDEIMGVNYYFMEGGDFVSVPAVADAFPSYSADSLKQATDSMKYLVGTKLEDQAASIILALSKKDEDGEEGEEEEEEEDGKKKKDQVKKSPKSLVLVQKLIDQNRGQMMRISDLSKSVKGHVDEKVLLKEALKAVPAKIAQIEKVTEELNRNLESLRGELNSLALENMALRDQIVEKIQGLSILKRDKAKIKTQLESVESSLTAVNHDLDTLKVQSTADAKKHREDVETLRRRIASLTLDNFKARALLDLPVQKRDEAKRLFESLSTEKDVKQACDKLSQTPSRDFGAREVSGTHPTRREGESTTADIMRGMHGSRRKD